MKRQYGKIIIQPNVLCFCWTRSPTKTLSEDQIKIITTISYDIRLSGVLPFSISDADRKHFSKNDLVSFHIT